MQMGNYRSVLILTAVMATGGLLLSGCEREQPTPAPQPGEQTQPVDGVSLDSSYPLTICLVSGQALDSMGGPVTFEYEGRQIQICCAGCEAAFKREPDKYLTLLEQASAGSAAVPVDHGHAGHNH